MNVLTPKTQETAYYTAVSAKLLKSYFSRWPMAAILDFCQLRLMPTLLRGTPLQFHSLKTKTLRNEPSLSTVTEVLQMTQLYRNYMVSHTENGGHLEKWPPF